MLQSPLPAHAVQQMMGHLHSIYPLEKELTEDLQAILRYEQIRRSAYLLRPGQVNDRLYYVHKGLLRCFYIKESEEGADREVSTWFMQEKDICVSILSFYGRRPGFEYIQAMEPCEVFSIAYDQLDGLYRKYFSLNYIGRVLTVKYLCEWSQQLQNIRQLRAEEWYEALKRDFPDLLQRVAHKYLASFLDINESTISRLRGR